MEKKNNGTNLLPEQMKSLSDRLSTLRVSIEKMRSDKQLHGVNIASDPVNGNADGLDESYEIMRLASEIDKLQRQINFANILSISNSEAIELGSEFTASIVDIEDPTDLDFINQNYMLVETRDGLSVTSNACTIDSPFGQAVLGKKAGDEFVYSIGSKYSSNTFVGKIHNVRK